MKLGVDARMMYGAWQHRGIGRYTNSILEQLPPSNITAFLPKNQVLDTYKTVSEGKTFFAWWEQKVLPQLAERAKIDYLLCPSITSPIQNIANTKKLLLYTI